MKLHLARLSVRDKCAQRIGIEFRFDDPDFGRVMPLFRKEGVGAVRLRGGSVFDCAATVNSFQKDSRFPLLVTAPWEDGPGAEVAGATAFPPARAVAATGSEELAQTKGRLIAREAKALAVRWLPAPPPGAFGEGGGRFAAAHVRGLREQRALVGASSGEADVRVLAGLPSSRPAFEGLLTAESADAVAAAKAGVDLVFGAPDPAAAVAALEEALRGGALDPVAFDHSVVRILAAKDRLGLLGERMTDAAGAEHVVGSVAHRAAAQRIADAAVALVRGNGRVEREVALVGAPPAFEAELRKGAAVSERGRVVAAAGAEAPGASIVVAFGPPELLRGAPAGADLVCAWGADEASQRAAAKALLGEIEYRGRVPAV